MVTRRTRFQLKKAMERLHIVEGLSIALRHLDEVIALILLLWTLTRPGRG